MHRYFILLKIYPHDKFPEAGLLGVLDTWAAVTEYHRLSGLNSRDLFSPSTGGLKSKIKMLAGFFSDETFLPGLRTSAFLLCPYLVFSLCAYAPLFIRTLVSPRHLS